MLEQLVMLFLIGLGVKTPVLPGSVLGDEIQATEVSVTQETKGKLIEKQKRERVASSGSDFKRKDFVEERRQIQGKFVQDVKNHRASASAVFKAEMEAFRNRLQTIKDTTKKTKLEQVSQVISQVNTNRTTAMTEKLTKMDEIITKITTGLTTLSEGGKDTSAVQTTVNTANTAISAAKSAVATQAGKEYVIGITSEANLGDDVSRVRTQLANDVKSVETAIAHARQAVAKAIAAYASLKGEPAQ